MKIVIITEGGKSIGFGHIVRCLSLACAFREKGHSVAFVVRGDGPFDPFLIGEDVAAFDWITERSRLSSSLEGADISIVDSYGTDSDFYSDIAKLVKTVLCIDDNKRIDYPCGIVLNGNIFADDLKYPATKGVKYLLGTRYIPLRKPFWDNETRIIHKEISSVMLIMGGSDSAGLAPSIKERIHSTFPSFRIDVVSGLNAADLKRLMLGSDIAISAGGQTLYELAVTGTPAVAVNVAENQFKNVAKWESAGLLLNAGRWDSPGLLDNIVNCVRRLGDQEARKKMMDAGRRNVDGKGALRVVDEVLKNA